MRATSAKRLTWRDGLATLFVGAAAAVWVLWSTGTAFSGTSTRIIGVMVFAGGMLACTSNQAAMVDVYGVGAPRRAPMWYVMVASVAGGLAFVTGILTLVMGSELMLTILVAATVAMWVMATLRHLAQPSDAVTARPAEHAGPALAA